MEHGKDRDGKRQDRTTRQPRQDRLTQQKTRYVSAHATLTVFGRQSSRKLLGPPNVAIEVPRQGQIVLEVNVRQRQISSKQCGRHAASRHAGVTNTQAPSQRVSLLNASGRLKPRRAEQEVRRFQIAEVYTRGQSWAHSPNCLQKG